MPREVAVSTGNIEQVARVIERISASNVPLEVELCFRSTSVSANLPIVGEMTITHVSERLIVRPSQGR
jgi:hypothetical protein